MTEGFDSLVDRLMNLEGYDRDEAEALALASLTAGESPENGRIVHGVVDAPRPTTPAPAVSHEPVEEGKP